MALNYLTNLDGLGGLASKKISLGWNPKIQGTIVVPDKGTVVLEGPLASLSTVILGAEAVFTAGGVEVDRMVVTGPGTKISVGSDSTFLSLESPASGYYSLEAGPQFTLKNCSKLSREYNLLTEINRLLDRALDPDW